MKSIVPARRVRLPLKLTPLGARGRSARRRKPNHEITIAANIAFSRGVAKSRKPHVALNTWTNYVNEVAKTEIDFPAIAARKAA